MPKELVLRLSCKTALAVSWSTTFGLGYAKDEQSQLLDILELSTTTRMIDSNFSNKKVLQTFWEGQYGGSCQDNGTDRPRERPTD